MATTGLVQSAHATRGVRLDQSQRLTSGRADAPTSTKDWTSLSPLSISACVLAPLPNPQVTRRTSKTGPVCPREKTGPVYPPNQRTPTGPVSEASRGAHATTRSCLTPRRPARTQDGSSLFAAPLRRLVQIKSIFLYQQQRSYRRCWRGWRGNRCLYTSQQPHPSENYE